VTSTKKNANYGKLITSGNIQSGRGAPASLGRSTSRGEICLGLHQQRENQFDSVVSQLDQSYATTEEDIITYTPERNSNTTLRTKLVRRLSLSREQHIRELFTFENMGGKPSEFL
jgi:hypothetical protein